MMSNHYQLKNNTMHKFIKSFRFLILIALVGFVSCEKFEEYNENPNEPTDVSPDVLLSSAIRSSVNTMVNESFLLGNNAAQLTAKTLRTEVDAYNWNAFPTVWEGLYESLTDVNSFERDAINSENDQLEGVALVLRSWIFATLTNAYGDIPFSEAIQGAETSNFTPVYDRQEDIYNALLADLERAADLLGNKGSISGDILFGNDAGKWQKLANSLRLRLLMTANNQLPDAGTQFAAIVNEGNIMTSNDDNATLTYLDAFPNQFPLIPLKTGDFDAIALSQTLLDVFNEYGDPRLMRYARPNNDMYNQDATFSGAANGSNSANCSKAGSRLGAQYYEDPVQMTAASLGLRTAEGMVMTYAEVSFLLAEAALKGWIDEDIETHYKNGIEASMIYHQVDPAPFGWTDVDDFYNNSGVAYDEPTDIWEQKWINSFFHGLEPYFEVRRWYFESGMDWSGIPFLSPPCENLNNDQLPMRFLYPGEEQSLNAINYDAAVDQLGGSNSQNATIWLVE